MHKVSDLFFCLVGLKKKKKNHFFVILERCSNMALFIYSRGKGDIGDVAIWLEFSKDFGL
jgi:hypothetical protein